MTTAVKYADLGRPVPQSKNIGILCVSTDYLSLLLGLQGDTRLFGNVMGHIPVLIENPALPETDVDPRDIAALPCYFPHLRQISRGGEDLYLIDGFTEATGQQTFFADNGDLPLCGRDVYPHSYPADSYYRITDGGKAKYLGPAPTQQDAADSEPS